MDELLIERLDFNGHVWYAHVLKGKDGGQDRWDWCHWPGGATRWRGHPGMGWLLRVVRRAGRVPAGSRLRTVTYAQAMADWAARPPSGSPPRAA